MRHWLVGIGAFGFLALSGCGIGGTASCDFRAGSSNGPEPRCQEWQKAVSTASVQAACTGSEGKYITGACPTEGIVGGCAVGSSADGSTTVDWYYAPKTVEEVKSECGSDPYKDPP